MSSLSCPMISISIFTSSILLFELYKRYFKINKENKKNKKNEIKDIKRNEDYVEPLSLPIINLEYINLRETQSELFQNECQRIAQGNFSLLSFLSFFS